MGKIRTSRRIKFLIIFITIVIVVMMFPKGESIEFEVDINSIWLEDDLIASMPYEILKDPLIIEREKAAAGNSVHQIFVKDKYISVITFRHLPEFYLYIISI